MKKILILILSLIINLFIINNTNAKENEFNNLLFYYWYPTFIWEWWKYFNDDKKIQDEKRIELVYPFFSQFKKIIWAWSIANTNHEEHENTIKLIEKIKNTTESYWYVPIYWDGNDLDSKKICSNVDKWLEMKVDWIFYDEVWFDYFQQKNKNYNDYIDLLKHIYDCAKNKNLKVIFNSWNPKDILNNLELDLEDWVLIESFYYWDGIKKQEYIDHVEEFKKLKNKTKGKYYCVATWQKWYSQEIINKIWEEIRDKMYEICEYRSVQDHYWTSSDVVYVTDDVLNNKQEKSDSSKSQNYHLTSTNEIYTTDDMLNNKQEKNKLSETKNHNLTNTNKTYTIDDISSNNQEKNNSSKILDKQKIENKLSDNQKEFKKHKENLQNIKTKSKENNFKNYKKELNKKKIKKIIKIIKKIQKLKSDKKYSNNKKILSILSKIEKNLLKEYKKLKNKNIF